MGESMSPWPTPPNTVTYLGKTSIRDPLIHPFAGDVLTIGRWITSNPFMREILGRRIDDGGRVHIHYRGGFIDDEPRHYEVLSEFWGASLEGTRSRLSFNQREGDIPAVWITETIGEDPGPIEFQTGSPLFDGPEDLQYRIELCSVILDEIMDISLDPSKIGHAMRCAVESPCWREKILWWFRMFAQFFTTRTNPRLILAASPLITAFTHRPLPLTGKHCRQKDQILKSLRPFANATLWPRWVDRTSADQLILLRLGLTTSRTKGSTAKDA
jgi:hypothetical protein